jgi:Methylamine utilisation protein MauE
LRAPGENWWAWRCRGWRSSSRSPAWRPRPSTEALRAAGFPAPAALVRILSVAELAAAAAGLFLSGRGGAAVLMAAFLCLAGGAALGGAAAGSVACGCFGDDDGPALGRRHVLVNLAAAGLCLAAIAVAPDGLPQLASAHPAVALLSGLTAVVLALGLRAWLRGGRLGGRAGIEAMAVRLAESSARAVEGRFSRRSALIRLAVAGSALTTAPLRYLLYPGTALGVVLPSDCKNGLCTDGYTAFCCEINQGLNTCPTGTFIGGWWKCTDYKGHQLCQDSGVRYYVDCNSLPGQPFPGGCRCANGSCDHRKQNCNVFRYGQCNTHIKGTTPVVCRVITCENPGHISGFGCSSALMVDDATCGHEAGCLEPPAGQFPGGGGA